MSSTHPIRTPVTGTTETAILAGGCFWGMQELLRHRDGVISTRVGYAGGDNENPTDAAHPGHAEAVEIRFDTDRISYRDILVFFFQIHDPTPGTARDKTEVRTAAQRSSTPPTNSVGWPKRRSPTSMPPASGRARWSHG